MKKRTGRETMMCMCQETKLCCGMCCCLENRRCSIDKK